jgi:hypothetical protein
MTDKMTVLFVKHTGHVLAAVTSNADPTAKISAGDLARGGLLVRGFPAIPPTTGNEQFEVPPGELDVMSVDLDPALLLKPRNFIIDDGQLVQIPIATVNNVALTTPTKVTVTLAAAVTEETKVWVQVDGGNLAEPRTAEGKIPNTGTSTELQIQTLDPGTYFVLTLVVDRLPDVRTQAIP